MWGKESELTRPINLPVTALVDALHNLFHLGVWHGKSNSFKSSLQFLDTDLPRLVLLNSIARLKLSNRLCCNIVFLSQCLSWWWYKPGVGLVVRVAAWDPRVLSSSPVGRWIKIHQEIDSACHPSEVGKMSTSVLVRGTLHQRHSCVPTNDATSSHRLH